MQTFLPYANFALSAHVLDWRRLGKQRLEGVQLLRRLRFADRPARSGWDVHPATRMWVGAEAALCRYTGCVIREWERRGYVNTMACPDTPEGIEQWELPETWLVPDPRPPAWLGHERFHGSHRAALLHKDPVWYAQFGWDEPAVYDYFWPSDLPRVGHHVISPEGVVWTVQEVCLDSSICFIEGTDRCCTVSHRDVQTRVWTAATRG